MHTPENASKFATYDCPLSIFSTTESLMAELRGQLSSSRWVITRSHFTCTIAHELSRDQVTIGGETLLKHLPAGRCSISLRSIGRSSSITLFPLPNGEHRVTDVTRTRTHRSVSDAVDAHRTEIDRKDADRRRRVDRPSSGGGRERANNKWQRGPREVVAIMAR
jgi:hypothetical protein